MYTCGYIDGEVSSIFCKGSKVFQGRKGKDLLGTGERPGPVGDKSKDSEYLTKTDKSVKNYLSMFYMWKHRPQKTSRTVKTPNRFKGKQGKITIHHR